MKLSAPLVLLVVGVFALGAATLLPMPNTTLSQVAQVASTPTFSFVSSSYSVQEGNTVSVKIKADSPVQQTTRVKLQTQSGTARSGSDFVPVTATVTFYRGGLATKSINFRTIRDSRDEGSETASVKMVSVNGRTVNKSATVTITDRTGTGSTTTTTTATCALNEPCDRFDPWRPFASRQTGGVVYEVKATPAFGSGGNSTGTFKSRQATHPKIGSVAISGKIVEPWEYSLSMFAVGNTRNIGIPGNGMAIFALTMPTNSPDYPTKTWTLEYINDTPTNPGAGAGFPVHVISKIPGDFNPNNVPEGCRQSRPYGAGGFILSVDPVTRQATAAQSSLGGICYLVPGQKYYYNVVYAVIDYSDVDTETKSMVNQWVPLRPPTTPMTYDANGKTARVIDTATCGGDNGSGAVFNAFCDQRWVFRTLDGGSAYITLGSEGADPGPTCNQFAPQHPGKKVYVTTYRENNPETNSLRKFYRCDASGPVLIPWLDQNY